MRLLRSIGWFDSSFGFAGSSHPARLARSLLVLFWKQHPKPMARLASVPSGLDRTASGQSPVQAPPLPDCNFLHLLANSPAALHAYQACAESLSQGQLTPQQRELLALTIAEINGAKYCLSAHYALSRKLGLNDNEIRAARRATSADPRTHAMLRFAQAVALQRGELSDADFQSLRQAGYTDALITEIVSHIALNIFTNYFNAVARTEIDFPLLKPGADAPARS
jgi:uncharacterized peroxidase-related enzyme